MAGPLALDRQLVGRLGAGGGGRLAAVLSDLLPALYGVIAKHRVSREEVRATIAFLSEVETTCSENRQEWVLLADALGLSMAVEAVAAQRPKGATPNTILGPFYRADPPEKKNGASISIDGVGVPLVLAVQIDDLDGVPVAGAQVDVWQANSLGRFENQDPDGQPDMNLRGRFTSDVDGKVQIRTIRPAPYALPDSGPVADLLRRLGLGLTRPAHIQFSVRAAGFKTLTTHIFDRADPAIDADPLFAAQPDLMADFNAATARITFKLARAHPGQEDL